ncbi:hypothetical protein MMC07_007787 [Pseudocyphellaria aurata]|nr:hypothetical protein [Pseudocyphellaria aurata]
MKCSILTSVFLLGVMTLALPSASSIDERSEENFEKIDGFLAPMTYVGPITPGGQNHTINGTAEEVHSKIIELNPSFNPHDWHVPERNGRLLFGSRGGALNALERRKKAGPPLCDVFNYCNTRRIQRGIDYLNDLPGGCRVGWGSDKCSLISCSDNAGISICNDVSFSLFYLFERNSNLKKSFV